MKTTTISGGKTDLCQDLPEHQHFTKIDYLVVRRALEELPLIEKLVVEMRFFHNFSIEEISRLLRMGWDETATLLESALPMLRRQCQSDPEFSRNLLHLKAA